MYQHEYNSNFEAEMDEAALRMELENELKSKKQCTYQPYECTQLCLDGFKYCSKHILQDKNAPYKQCSYMYSSNGKKCNLSAPRSDKKDHGFCSEHALKNTLSRNRHNAKHPLPCTAEVLLHSLSHYVKTPRIRSSSSSTQYSDDGDRNTPDSEQKSPKFLDPFVDFDASSLYNEKCNDILDVCSESESDIEASTFSSVWQDAQADSSDDESIDSEHEDVLKHANVYTAEEITLMTKDKLVRLQSLYIEQYRHLQYLLTKKRRKYLHSLKREKETCCNIYNQVRDNPKEQRLYKKLKALNNYQKCHGVDAILSKRLRDLRVKATDGTSKSQIYSKCIFTEGGVKCGDRSLPLAKHCQKHILEDPNQVLFRACGTMTADVECPTPIAAIFDDSTCLLHLEIPFLKSYHQVRKDSESDVEETADAHLNFQQPSTHISENIKTEFINYDIPPEIPKMESLPSMLFEESSPRNMSDIPDTSSMFNVNFSSITENGNSQNLLEESMKNEDNIMELSTSFVENEISVHTEVKDEKMDVTEDTVEVTKEDIDVTASADIDVAEETVSEENIADDNYNVEETTGIEDGSSVEETPNIGVEDGSSVEETPNIGIEDGSSVEETPNIEDSSIVEDTTKVKDCSNIVEDTIKVEDCPTEVESELHEIRVNEDHNSDMRDTAVDALLKAAEMISDQDNIDKMNAEMSLIQPENIEKVDEFPVKEETLKVENEITTENDGILRGILEDVHKNV